MPNLSAGVRLVMLRFDLRMTFPSCIALVKFIYFSISACCLLVSDFFLSCYSNFDAFASLSLDCGVTGFVFSSLGSSKPRILIKWSVIFPSYRIDIWCLLRRFRALRPSSLL